MPHKVITDKNGRMRTVDVEPPPSREAIDTLRREVKDIVAGNTQFHDDEFAKPKALPPIDGFLTEDEWIAPCMVEACISGRFVHVTYRRKDPKEKSHA